MGFVSQPPTNPYPGYFNLDPSMLPHWRSVVAKVRAGTGRGTLVFVGDSTTVGNGAGTSGSGNLVGAQSKNYPNALATLLNSFVTTSSNSFMNDHATAASGVTLAQYDARVTLGSGWATTGSTGGIGGQLVHFTTGSASTLSFTPTGTFDTIDVWWVRSAGNGGFTVNIDGGASLGTIATAGTQLFSKTSFSVTRGTHTINCVALNDAAFFLAGIVVKDSTISAIDFIQCGASGTKTADFVVTTNPWNSLPALGTLAPDLTIINLTINDSNAPTALATYSSQMQSIITKAQLTGDVILMVGAPSGTTAATDGTLDSFVAALTGLAATNNCPLVNLKQIWTSYAVKNAITPYFDTLHPTAVGYQDIAQAVLKVLTL